MDVIGPEERPLPNFALAEQVEQVDDRESLSADFIISSPLMASEYRRLVPDYDALRPFARPRAVRDSKLRRPARPAYAEPPSAWGGGAPV